MNRNQAPSPESPEPDEDLRQKNHEKAEERTSISAHVVHEAIRQEGEDELRRPSSALVWSALAAGLSMGFSLVAEGLLHAMLPDAPWRPLISKFGYCIGFLIVILGRQQLFTENTLTVILPLLHRHNWATAKNVARLWAIVLAANLVGTLLFAWVLSHTDIFEAPIKAAFAEIGREAMHRDAGTTFLRAIFAGWLIALMVWLLPFAAEGRVLVIIILTFVVGIGGFPHIIAGSVEVFYLVLTGAIGWLDGLGDYLIPTLLGNIVGGVALVAMLNHAQVVAGGEDM